MRPPYTCQKCGKALYDCECDVPFVRALEKPKSPSRALCIEVAAKPRRERVADDGRLVTDEVTGELPPVTQSP
jgi:hypothetical protein